jgi:hypothetical protein
MRRAARCRGDGAVSDECRAARARVRTAPDSGMDGGSAPGCGVACASRSASRTPPFSCGRHMRASQRGPAAAATAAETAVQRGHLGQERGRRRHALELLAARCGPRVRARAVELAQRGRVGAVPGHVGRRRRGHGPRMLCVQRRWRRRDAGQALAKDIGSKDGLDADGPRGPLGRLTRSRRCVAGRCIARRHRPAPRRLAATRPRWHSTPTMTCGRRKATRS